MSPSSGEPGEEETRLAVGRAEAQEVLNRAYSEEVLELALQRARTGERLRCYAEAQERGRRQGAGFAAKRLAERQARAVARAEEAAAKEGRESADLGAAFHSEKPRGKRKILKETAIHRLAAHLFCSGKSQKAVAELLGVTQGAVSRWWAQDWFRAVVKEEMALCGRDPVSKIIEGAATDSVHQLIAMRDNRETPAGVRRACCSELLDRALGKPAQTVHQVGYEGGDVKDIARVDEDLRAMLSDRALMQSCRAGDS